MNRRLLLATAASLCLPKALRSQTTLLGSHEAPAGAGVTVYGPYAMTGTSDGGWASSTFVQKLAAANLAAATGTQVRITIDFSALGWGIGNVMTAYFGQQAAAGDPYDFSGTQVHILFSGTNLTSDGVTTHYVSDWVTLGEAYDETKTYLFAAQFVGGSGVNLAPAADASAPGDSNYFQTVPSADAATTNKSGYGGNSNDRAEFVSKVEIQ